MSGQSGGHRLLLSKLNDQLKCTLCSGYLIDATTIIECLHSFCRSCIVKYLEVNKYCPICEVLVHKSKPLLNIRPDHTLQDIVYKLVPGCYQNEMRCRREFYAKHPESKNVQMSPESRGEPIESHIYSADESLSLSLEYYSANGVNSDTEDDKEIMAKCLPRRYLRCPAAVTVFHLQKLIRAKYGLTDAHRVDIMYKEEPLGANYTLMDVMYIYHWRRKVPLHLSYRIFESSSKRMKLAEDNNEFKQSLTNTGMSAIETRDEPTTKRGWKEVQLKISETGVMSVTDITSPDSKKAASAKTTPETDIGANNDTVNKLDDATIARTSTSKKNLMSDFDKKVPTDAKRKDNSELKPHEERKREKRELPARETKNRETERELREKKDNKKRELKVKKDEAESKKPEIQKRNANLSAGSKIDALSAKLQFQPKVGQVNNTYAKKPLKKPPTRAEVKKEALKNPVVKICDPSPLKSSPGQSKSAETPEISKKPEIIKKSENSETSKKSESSEIAKKSENAKKPETPEIPKSGPETNRKNSGRNVETVKNPEIPKSAGNLPEVSKSAGITNNPEVAKSSELAKNPKVAKSSEPVKNPEVAKSSELAKNPEVAKSLEPVKNPEVAILKTPEIEKSAGKSPEVPKVTETSPKVDIPKNSETVTKSEPETVKNAGVSRGLNTIPTYVTAPSISREKNLTMNLQQALDSMSNPKSLLNQLNFRNNNLQGSSDVLNVSTMMNPNFGFIMPDLGMLSPSKSQVSPISGPTAQLSPQLPSGPQITKFSQSSSQLQFPSTKITSFNVQPSMSIYSISDKNNPYSQSTSSSKSDFEITSVPMSLMKSARKHEVIAKGTNLNEICAKITSGAKINDICAKIGENSKEKNKTDTTRNLPDLLKITKSTEFLKHIPNIPNVPIYTPNTKDKVVTSTGIVTKLQQKKHSHVGYKTLRDPPKPWNPTLSKNNYVTVKNQSQFDGGSSKPILSKPAKIFKMRNVPRYLGNPASGVKPMYGVSNEKEKEVKSNLTGSAMMMKIDPKTLSPIVSTSNSPIVSPPPYSPNARSYQNSPFTRDMCRNSGSPISPRNSPVNMLSTNPFIPSPTPNTNPRLIYSHFPPPFPDTSRFPNPLIRSPIGIPPPSAFHSSLPPSINKLYQRTSYIPQTSGYNPVVTQQPPAVQRIPPSPAPSASFKSHDVTVVSSSSEIKEKIFNLSKVADQAKSEKIDLESKVNGDIIDLVEEEEEEEKKKNSRGGKQSEGKDQSLKGTGQAPKDLKQSSEKSLKDFRDSSSKNQSLMDSKEVSQSSKESSQSSKNSCQSFKDSPQSSKDSSHSLKNSSQSSKDSHQSLKNSPQSLDSHQSLKNSPQSSKDFPQSSKDFPQSSKDSCQSSRDFRQSLKDSGQSRDSRQSLRESCQSAKKLGQSSGESGQSSKESGQSSGESGQSSKEGQLSKDKSQSSRESESDARLSNSNEIVKNPGKLTESGKNVSSDARNSKDESDKERARDNAQEREGSREHSQEKIGQIEKEIQGKKSTEIQRNEAES